MKVFDSIYRPRTKLAAYAVRIVLVSVVFVASEAVGPAASSVPGYVRSEESVDALALKWFAQMQAGQIDRTQLTAEYSAQLSDDAVQGMSRYLKEHDYGAPPLRAEIVETRTMKPQTLYVVKLVFPRGDAASLLVGFNTEGKITGISLLSMAGD